MKRLLSVLILVSVVCFAFAAAPSPALADDLTPSAGEYLKVVNDNVVFSSNTADSQNLFNLPKTYYVEFVKELSGGRYRVKYMGLTGIVDNGATNLAKTASSDRYPVTADNASLPLTLALANNAEFTAVDEYFELAGGVPAILTPTETLTFAFIGFSNLNGAAAAFVKNNETLSYGFIAVSNLVTGSNKIALSDYSLPLHVNSRPVVTEEPAVVDPPADETPEPSPNKTVRTLLIVGIVIPALLIIFLLFKPAKKKGYDYNRNQGYDYGPSVYDQPRARYNDRPYYDDRYERPRYDDRPPRYDGPPREGRPQGKGYYDERDRYYDERDRYYDDRRY